MIKRSADKLSISKQRLKIVDVVRRSGWPGHLSSAMSVLELLNVLYLEIFSGKNEIVDKSENLNSRNDLIILSKGHAALALYVVLEELGYITEAQLFTFNNYGSLLGSHPCRHKVPTVEVNTGSLGHGIPAAVGIAYGFKLSGRSDTVYVIAGDGEMNEGSNWEAMNTASYVGGLNICLIIDLNGDTLKGSNTTCDLFAKSSSFGWAPRVINGHCLDEIYKAISESKDGLNVVIANTVKGKGFAAMEQDPEGWHYRAVTDEEFDRFAAEVL